jgi:heme oxygenase
VRALLRASTADAHARVDTVFSCFDLGRRAAYASFLQAQGEALIPLERALDEGAASALAIDWPARRRSAALLRDLALLGRPASKGRALAAIDTPEEALGTIYVLEGSRLGGAVLRRSVGSGLPTEFLSAGPPTAWRVLLDTLERTLLTSAQVEAATAAASRAFGLFEASGHTALGSVEAR